MSHRVSIATWQGRQDSDPKALRVHHIVKPFQEEQSKGWVLIGYACDQGVQRNQGRIGAAKGPDCIRRALANMAWHHPKTHFYDAGNIQQNDFHCVEEQQEALACRVQEILNAGHRPIVVGGGHDLSYGSWLGLSRHQPTSTVAIVNFDAHLDLREHAQGAHSGTPFRQIASDIKQQNGIYQYSCIGVSRSANTADLFHTARELGVSCILDQQCLFDTDQSVQSYLQGFVQTHDVIQMSIDLDVLPSTQAPGVSAPAALGLDLLHLQAYAQILLSSGKVRVIDIAEYNPEYDIDWRTAKSAAYLIHTFIHHQSESL